MATNLSGLIPRPVRGITAWHVQLPVSVDAVCMLLLLEHKFVQHRRLCLTDACFCCRFQWVDGALTRAVESGQWALLDSANLCNPTVLDRLNPLLEPAGELLLVSAAILAAHFHEPRFPHICSQHMCNMCGSGPTGSRRSCDKHGRVWPSQNEAGAVDGRPRVVRPHRDFRLILAMDPRHGEMSRAMRNRGVELFLLPEQADADRTTKLSSQVSVGMACVLRSFEQPKPDSAAPRMGSATRCSLLIRSSCVLSTPVGAAAFLM